MAADVAGEEQEGVRVRVSVDREICVGAAQCVLTAPEFFDQDDEGIVTLLDSRAPGGKAALVEDAARLCPSRAITVVREPAAG